VRDRGRDKIRPRRRVIPPDGDAARLAVPSNVPFYLATVVIAYLSLLALGDWWAVVGAAILPGAAAARASPVITRRQAAFIAGRVGGVYGCLRGIVVTFQYLVLGGRQAYSASSGTPLPPLDLLTVVGTVLAQITIWAADIVIAAAIGTLVYTVLSRKWKGARRR